MSEHAFETSASHQDSIAIEKNIHEDISHRNVECNGVIPQDVRFEHNNALQEIHDKPQQTVLTTENHPQNLVETSFTNQQHVLQPQTIPPPIVAHGLHSMNQQQVNQIASPLLQQKDMYDGLPKMGLMGTTIENNSSLMPSTMSAPSSLIDQSSINSVKKPRKTEKQKLRDLYAEHGNAWKMVKYSTETGIKEDYCRRLINSLKKGDDITNKKKRGPPPKHSLELLKEIVQEVKIKGKSTREASKQLKVSPSSICRYMKKEEAKRLLESTLSDPQSTVIMNQGQMTDHSNHLVNPVEIPKMDQQVHTHLNPHMNITPLQPDPVVLIKPEPIQNTEQMQHDVMSCQNGLEGLDLNVSEPIKMESMEFVNQQTNDHINQTDHQMQQMITENNTNNTALQNISQPNEQQLNEREIQQEVEPYMQEINVN
ncbi:HTH psq-type domain-containing protein [Entamoeba marina]